MTKLQKRSRSGVCLPLTLQAGTTPSPSLSPPMPSNKMSSSAPIASPANDRQALNPPLSPFQKTHRRAVSSPRTPQTQWPLISTSSPPSIPYPTSPHHDTSQCGSNCTRCGKKKLIQLNSPPTAVPLRPIPQAHMRTVSDGEITRSSIKCLKITTTPAAQPTCCHKCGKPRRPASLPAQASSQPPRNYHALRTHISGATPGTPHPSKTSQSRSQPPSPPSPANPFTPQPPQEPHIIFPLSPRRKAKVDFAPLPLPSNSTSISASPPLSVSEEPEHSTRGLITMISTAIRESSPPSQSYAKLHSRTSSVDAQVGMLGSADVSEDEDAQKARLARARRPVDTKTPWEAVELDSMPVEDVTKEIIDCYGDGDEKAVSLTGTRKEESEEVAEWSYDWTDAMPVIRIPSVREGISRFKSLRGGQSQSQGFRRGLSVRERFGSLRGNRNGMQQQQGWYGGLGRSGSGYQALGSNVEVGGY